MTQLSFTEDLMFVVKGLLLIKVMEFIYLVAMNNI
jgi:hypothetical protein